MYATPSQRGKHKGGRQQRDNIPHMAQHGTHPAIQAMQTIIVTAAMEEIHIVK